MIMGFSQYTLVLRECFAVWVSTARISWYKVVSREPEERWTAMLSGPGSSRWDNVQSEFGGTFLILFVCLAPFQWHSMVLMSLDSLDAVMTTNRRTRHRSWYPGVQVFLFYCRLMRVLEVGGGMAWCLIFQDSGRKLSRMLQTVSSSRSLPVFIV